MMKIFYILVCVFSIVIVLFEKIKIKKKVSKNKKMKLSFFTALANAPYELLIPYGQIGAMIFGSTIL